MNRRETTSLGRLLVLLSMTVAVLAPPAAFAGSCISGTVTAGPSDHPELGQYAYHVSMTWGPLQNGLSHWNLWLGHLECDPMCAGPSPFGFAAPAGFSGGTGIVDHCTVNYAGELLCDGDPSIHLPGPLIKYRPVAGQSCHPGKSGNGEFVFYSNWPPGPSQTVQNVLVAKFGNAAPCSGPLTGPLPSCGIPSGTERTSWGSIKGIYKK